jgi:hypothetical protein
MKLNMNDFKKVKEDKNTITLMHPRHGHQINVAKNSLSQKMKSDFAAMPLHQAYGSDQASKSPRDPDPQKAKDFMKGFGYSKGGKVQNYANVEDLVKQDQPAPQIDPETQAKHNLYNEYITGTYGPDAAIAQQNMSGSGNLFEGEKAPAQFNPEAAKAASDKFDQEKAASEARAKTQQAEDYQRAQESNDAKLKMGLPPDQLPPAPPQQPQYQQTQFQQPAAPQAPAIPPEQMNAMAQANDQAMQSYMKGYGEQKAGIGAEAQAQGELGRQQAAAAQEQAQQVQNFEKHKQESYDALNQRRQNLVNNYPKLNPNQYLENMSTPGKIGTAIGMILSGAGSGLTGQSNMAMDILNKQIDRDIQGQLNAQGVQDTLLKTNQEDFKNMNDALTMTRLNMLDIYKNKIDQIAGQNASPLAQARAQQLKGQLDLQAAPLMQQMSLRQAAFRGMKSGNIDPSMIIQYAAPEKDREHLMTSLQHMQNDTQALDNLRETAQQVRKVNTLENRVMNPLESKRQVDALIEPTLGKLTKDTEGRVTPTDLETIRPLFHQVGDDAKTDALKQQKLDEFVSSKMNYPDLAPYGIRPKQKFKPQSSFNLAPPVRR